jgi:low temperature requirement protein LtrA
MILLAWFNGTFWHELHGREDGRGRLYIFGQTGLLALGVVYAGRATGADGAAFAVTYAVLFAQFTWQWYVERRIDEPKYRSTTTPYLAGMLATVPALVASSLVGGSTRLWIWGAVVVLWVVGGVALVSTDRAEGFGEGVTASLVERVGLFTIIVLGEVVVGVVGGITALEARSTQAIATGVIGLWDGPPGRSDLWSGCRRYPRCWLHPAPVDRRRQRDRGGPRRDVVPSVRGLPGRGW